MLAVDSMSDNTGLLFGKYKLLELIARGGMAEVFKAKSFGADGFEKIVVIKRILPEFAQNQQFVDMAINEAKLSVALSHANIVQVFDLGREEDTYFIVMEYVQGMDFADALRRARKRGDKPPVELCLYICSETARALDYAHRRRDAQMRPLNIVHRDVSPQNILLSLEGEVKVTDFGIAKARNSMEEAGTVKGKYAYMAPEQARGEHVDGRADVCALGIVLYECLAGKNPFQERTAYETFRRVQTGEKVPLELVWKECPDELARIVAKATHPDRQQRHASGAKLYEDLAGYLYTTGKRVTSHDLAQWLETLRGDDARETEAHRVRDALEDAGKSSLRTPVEVPAGARSRPGPSTSSGLGRTNVERRDATLLSAEFSRDTAGVVEPHLSLAQRYGGVVKSIDEEHCTWVFDATATDGRDTECAARAALKLRHAFSRDPRLVHIGLGLHAARLHVRSDGEAENDQWYNSAVAVVRDLARAGSEKILASESLQRILRDGFAFAPMMSKEGQLTRIPGAAVELVAERSTHDGTRKKFVGRKDGFRLVGDIFARASRQGVHAINVVGDAGIGKSRFVAEVEYRLQRMNHPVSWYSVRCLPTDKDVPGAAVAAILRAILALDETDPDSVVREGVNRFRELGLSADELSACAKLLGVAGPSDRPGSGAQPLRTALARIGAGLARDQLTVLFVDGAEHLDDASHKMINDLIRSGTRARLVFVTATRTGTFHPWSDTAKFTEIVLGPLTDEETKSLVALRLGVLEPSLPRDLVDDVVAKSSGNPLFIEEHLRSLSDAGAVEVQDSTVVFRRSVAEVEVPKTLRGLVLVELARMPAEQRTVLQVASVIGPRFHREVLLETAPLMQSQANQALAALIDRGAIVRAGDEFAFAHDLRREVVYEGLALETRRELHATVAAVTERLFAGRLDELADRLAVHYRESNDRPRAVQYLERAGRRRYEERAFSVAATHFSRAVELAQAAARPDSTHILSLYQQLGDAVAASGHVPSFDRLKMGLQYVEELGDPALVLRALMQLGQANFQANRFGEALTYFERAREMVASGNVPSEQFDVLSAIGSVYAKNGEFGRAQAILLQAIRLIEQQGSSAELCTTLLTLARSQGSGGDIKAALASWQRAVDISLELGEPALVLDTQKSSALIWYHAREFEKAALESEHALETAREYNVQYEIAVNAHNAGDAWARLGDYRRAYTNLRISQDVCIEQGYDKLENLNNVVLAFVDAIGFGSDAARARIEHSLKYAEEHGYKWDILHCNFLLGVIARERGEMELARDRLRDGLSLAQELDNHLYVEDCQRMLREMTSVPPPPGKR
jgi:serine/threonine protein kinase/tetratricopeptide (TPR) repeat protein